MKFNIGDIVWVASAAPVETWVPCPHCFGKKSLTVIFGDGSQASIDCAGCSQGYESPKGVVVLHEYKARVEPNTITGMDARQHNGKMEVTYWSGCGGFNEENAFGSIEDAQKRANTLIDEKQAEEKIAFEQRKERHDKTWSWNATYHRQRIKEAQKALEYHTAKLNVAKFKAKEGES